MRTSSLGAALAAALGSGCFSDPPSSTSADSDDGSAASSEGDDTGSSSAGTGGTGTATQGGGSVSSTNATSTDSGEGTTDPSDTTDDMPGSCGELGEPCCMNDACDRGMCHTDTCIAFRGAFADPLLCEECRSDEHLATLTECDCDGFPPSPAFPILSDTCMPAEPSVATDLFMCAADLDAEATGSDWGGAYMLFVESACGDVADPCIVANQYTDVCECPPGMDAIVSELAGTCVGGGGPASYQLVVCSSTTVEPISFGGAFEVLDGGTCAAGNPRVDGKCDCPTGFQAQGLRIISSVTGFGSTLDFCVEAP